MRLGLGIGLARRSGGATRGPDLVVNGGFADATGWTTSGTVSIAGGVASFATSPSGDSVLQSLIGTGINLTKTHEVTYTIVTIAGSLSSAMGATLGASRSSPGTYTDIILPASANVYIRARSTGTTATIDNISVREVLA